MKNRIKQFIAIAALFAFASSITSCNRGYGCPNNFKAKVVNTVVDNIVDSFVKK